MAFQIDSEKIYQVKLELFEGPLDLLLHLIEQEELDITRISLAQVTDQYLSHIDLLEEVHPENLADFLVVAAKLLLIKSQVLLPRPQTMIEFDEEDPGEALARQLREYKQFKKIAQYLKERAASGAYTFVRLAPPPKLTRKVDLSDVTLTDLLDAMRQALVDRIEDEIPALVSPEPRITINDKIALLRNRLAQERCVTFSSLLEQAHSRMEIIVTLLALLEMFKAIEITLHQDTPFGEIQIQAK
ncbi:MAG: hypothetical protein B6I34_03305 [Anaerolineaceae bacterium 4572_32.1]|nr:MAG: hypothetical protein B6I34_03305 [Anaerolineaceae bacterium 4572_32.1]